MKMFDKSNRVLPRVVKTWSIGAVNYRLVASTLNSSRSTKYVMEVQMRDVMNDPYWSVYYFPSETSCMAINALDGNYDSKE